MLFDKFWGIAGDVVFLNYYSGILKRKHIYKKSNNNNFHHLNKFFCIVIEAMIVILYIYIAKYFTIDKL